MKKTKQKTNKLICILLSGFFTFYGIPTDLNAQTTPSDELTAQKPSAQNNILTLDEMNAKTSEMIKKLKNSKKDSSFFELGSEDGALSRSESRIARKKSIDKFTERKNDVDPSTLEDARFMALEDAVDVEGAAFGAMIKSSSINAESLRKFSEKSAEGVLISAKKDGRVVAFYFTSNHESNVSITEAAKEMVASLSAQGYVVSTVHNQPSGTEPSSADYEMAAQFSGGKHFIVSNDKAVEFSSGKAIERGLSSVARSFRSFSFNHEGSDDAALRKIAHEGFQKFLAVVEAAVETQNTDKLTHRFVAEVPQINGVTTTGNPATTLPVVASTTLSGKYNNYQSTTSGVKWVYDVHAPEADGSTLKIDRTGENMNLGANFVVHAQAETNGATPIASPVKTRIRFTDKNFNLVEADLLVTSSNQAFVIDFSSINAAFDSSAVKKIEFVHDKSIVGTDNRRANILVGLGNLGSDLIFLNGQTKGAEPTSLSNLPTATFSGEYVGARNKSAGLVNGFSYVYSIGHSSFGNATATISSEAGNMSSNGTFKLWLNAQAADSAPIIAPSYPVKATVQFTDKDGKIFAVNVNIFGEDKEFVFDLAGAGLDFNNLKDIKILHSREIVQANTRILMNVGVKGLASDAAVITGTTPSGSPDSISNLPVESQSGRYLTQIAKEDGFEFRYSTGHDSKDTAVFTLSNPNGTMGVDQAFTFFAKAKPASAAPSPALIYPVKSLVRFTDSSGKQYAVTIALEADLKAFTINLPAIGDLDFTSLTSIDWVQSQAVDPVNKRANIEVEVGGLFKDTANLAGSPITEPVSSFAGAPTIKVTGQFGNERSNDLGAAYAYDVRHAANHELKSTIAKENGASFALNDASGVWTFHMKAEELGATLTPPVKTMLRITDANGNVIAKVLEVTTDLQQYQIDLNVAGFDKDQISKIEFIQSNSLNITNGRALMKISLVGIGQKENISFTRDIRNNQTIVTTLDALTGDPIRQDIYRGLFDNLAALVGENPFQTTLFQSDTERLVIDKQNGIPIRYTKQTDIDDDPATVLIATPVDSEGDEIIGETSYTVQKSLGNNETLISSPTNANGTNNAQTTHTLQKALNADTTLIASPVDDVGATKADTTYTKQERLVDGRILVSTPVSPTGGILTDDLSTPNIKEPTTAFSTQKTLADGRTLVASPVSAIGATDADTIYTTQETLVDGRILVSTPVSPNGSFIPGETGHTVQKALSPTKTLIKTPVDEFGNFIPDVTEYSTQETINSTTTLIARPVDVNGDIIFEATEFSLQISTLDPKVTLIASPVSETGVIDGDTFYTRQEDLGANKTFISTPVESSGAFKTNTAHSLQERVGAVESLILTNVDAVTKAGTSTTQTIYAQDTDDDLRIDIQDVYDATCTLAVVQAGSCSPLSQRIFFLSSAQQIIHQPKNTRGNRTDVDQTILAFLDENGNITKQIVYEGGLAVSIADLNAKVAANVLTLSQTIHFIEDAPIVVKPALGMAISDISPLPGAVFEASIGSGATTTWNGRGMDFVFDTTVQGFAAGGFAYNDTALGDFSSVQQLAFGIQRTGGNVGEMFFTVEDSDGDKVSMRVTELNTSEQILAFSIADLVRLNPELDLNKIKIMFFEVQGSNLIGGFKINRIANPVQGGILHSNNALDLRDIQSVANDYTALDVFGTGASATTMKSSRGINLTYNTGTGAGPFSGGFASYAPAADFSTLNQLVVGVEGISGNTDRIKIEIEDNIGNKSHVYIDDIIDGKESVFSISMESFLGSANLSEIKAMLFIVEGAGKSGEVNINFEPTIVTIPRAQLIEDHKNNQTLKATMAADGVTIIRQDVYKGIHSTLGALVRAELIQQVITDGDEQLLIDPVRNQTVHGFLNDDEEFVQQDVYTGVYYAFADLDPLKLIQRIYFLLDDPHTQLMQTFGTGPNGEDQTIMVTLGADGKTTTRHDIYNNVLADELSDLDIGNPYQSVIFISDTEQLLQVHSYGVTFQRIFDPVTFLLTEEHIYPGIINTTDDTNLSILQSTYVISETQRIVLDFTVQPFAQTIVFTFDEDGYVVMRKIYDELPPLGTLDVSGMLLLMTVIPLDETRTMILQHANHVYVPTDQILYPNETWIEHVSFADPNNPVLLRRDVYDGIIPDPADLPADPNTLVFFPAPNVILVKDRDSDQTVVTTYGTQTCVDIYSDVKYDTYDGTLTWDLTVTGLEHLSQSCS